MPCNCHGGKMNGLGGLFTSDDPNDTRSWLTRARDWLADSSVVNAAVDLQNYTVEETQAAIDALYRAGIDFQNTWNQLRGYSSQVAASGSPELQQQYADLVSRGSLLGATLSDAVSSVQSIGTWVKQNVGIDLSTPQAPGTLYGLGFVQLIPLAIIGGVLAATALAVAWITDARSAITKIQALQQLVQSVPEAQRAAVIKDALAQSGGIANTVSKTTSLLVVAGVIAAGIYLAPEIKRLFNRS